ncbi:hypothetical protein LUX73_43975 [Actinomadura madurae]|nr:hypothetical protein [Actinomadura madurae]MCQ0010970.1 hypothetical protein [Actinomadura madurae]
MVQTDVRLEHEAEAAVDVHAVAGDPGRDPGRVGERHHRQLRACQGFLGLEPGRLQREVSRRFDGLVRIDQTVADRLERRDRDAELVPFQRVAAGQRDRPVAEAHQRRGGDDPPLGKRFPPLLPGDVAGRQDGL